MTEKNKEMLQYLYTGNDVASYTMELIEKRRAEQKDVLHTGISTLDRHMKPWLPGELIIVLGPTSHGKTSLMQAMTRNTVKQLQQRTTTDEIAVYASWETLTEELGLYDLAAMTGIEATRAWYGQHSEDEAARLQVAAMRRAGMPLWVLADSLKRRRRDKAMTVAAIDETLHIMEDSYGVTPAVIFADYLQIIKSDEVRADRRVQVMHNVDALRELGRNCGAPVVVGCQAGRQVLERDFKLPEIGDGQETSRIEQDADKVLSLWYPSKTEGLGARIDVLDVEVTRDLIVMGIRKQRHAESGQVFPLRFDAARNLFTSWTEESSQGGEPAAVWEDGEMEF